jgi:plastocyanin
MPATPRTADRRRRSSLAPIAIVTLALTMAVTACSPSASPTDGTDDGGGGGGDNAVTLTGSAFSPTTLTVSAGEAIEITNDGPQHRIVEGTDGSEVDDPAFEALTLATGDSGSVTFDEPGTYNLTCTIHPSMNMTVVVE